MEKTAMTQLRDKLAESVKKDNDGSPYFDALNFVIKDIDAQMMEIEKEQLCDMYIEGRNDNPLDWYPEKHALETYNEKYSLTYGK